MEFLSKTTHLDFMGKRRLALVFSGVLIVLSLIGLFARGLNFGIEFTGGVVIEVGFPMAADLTAVRSGLAEAGFGGAVVQNFGSSRDVVIQLEAQESGAGSAVRDQVMEVLRGIDSGVNLRRVEFVGPQVGEERAEAGGLATLFALLMILGYVAFRFQWKFAVGAVAALVHDVIITLGFFAVTTVVSVLLGMGITKSLLPFAPETVRDFVGVGTTEAPRLPGTIEFLLGLIPSNPFAAAAEGALLPLIVFTIFVGAATGTLPSEDRDRLLDIVRAHPRRPG